MYEHCKSCVHDDGDIGFCDKCGYTYIHRKRGLPPTEYEAKPKPQTNADRIRSMTDEKLDGFLNEVQGDAYLVGFHARAESRFTPYGKSWLDWLRQEASE